MSTDSRTWAKDSSASSALPSIARPTDRSGVTQVQNTLGDSDFALGDYAHGLAVLDEALAYGRQLGDRRLIAESLHRAGIIRAAQGEIALRAACRKRVRPSAASSATVGVSPTANLNWPAF